MITFAASDGHGGKTRDDLSCGEVNRKPTRGRLLGKNWVKQTCAMNNLCKSSYWMIFPGDCFFCFEKNAMTFWASENPVFVLKSGCKSVKIQKLVTSWWLQPIWKYARQIETISSGIGVKIPRNIWVATHLEKFQSQQRLVGIYDGEEQSEGQGQCSNPSDQTFHHQAQIFHHFQSKNFHHAYQPGIVRLAFPVSQSLSETKRWSKANNDNNTWKTPVHRPSFFSWF